MEAATSPAPLTVETHVSKTVRGRRREALETCFWLGMEGAPRPPPLPAKEGVYLREDERPRTFFVR